MLLKVVFPVVHRSAYHHYTMCNIFYAPGGGSIQAALSSFKMSVLDECCLLSWHIVLGSVNAQLVCEGSKRGFKKHEKWRTGNFLTVIITGYIQQSYDVSWDDPVQYNCMCFSDPWPLHWYTHSHNHNMQSIHMPNCTYMQKSLVWNNTIHSFLRMKLWVKVPLHGCVRTSVVC